MKRSRLLPVVIAVLILSLALMGCGIVNPTVRLLTAPTATATPRTVERIVVVTATPQAGVAAPSAPRPAVTVAPPITLNIAPGADVETQLLEAIYQKVNPSVVYIENLTAVSRTGRSTTQALPESSGSGFVWDAQGHIVTNNHVVRGADRVQVTFSDGIVLPAQIVGTDADSDLAVIRVDPSLIKLTPVEQGSIAEVKVGQRAIAIGNPFGLVGTMTSGIVSAIGRSIPSDPNQAVSFNIPQVIQTDAAVNPGNSGGPLLNARGQVIGVNTQIVSSSGSSSGVGFAVPINIVQRAVPAIIKEGRYRHAYLGITGQTYSPAWAEALGFPRDARGAYVSLVVSGGPAAQAGLRSATSDTQVILGMGSSGPIYLQKGGDLITAIDGQPVTRFDDLLVYLESFKSPGDDVKLTVLRAGEGQKLITLRLGERPSRTQ